MQIHGLTAAPPLRPVPGRPSVGPVASTPGPQDGYSGTIPGAAESRIAEAPAADRETMARLGQRVLLGALAGLSLFGALGLASPALANEGAAPAASISRSDDLAEARRYGLSDQTAQRLQTRPELVEALRGLPPDVPPLYRSLSPSQRKVVFQEIMGKTRIGPFTVNHRKAFVEGQVMGMDPLPRMLESIDKHVEKGDLTDKEAQGLKDALTRLIRLGPLQREAIATVIEFEGAGK